jgi:hypothetical protein
MNIYVKVRKMKPQVPDILSKFYDKHDPAAFLHEIQTEDLPELGTLYRDNTTGIVWEVLAHSGGDLYDAVKTNYLGYCENTSLLKKDRERLVILQSVEPEGVTMHVKPDVIKSRIHSSEHYKVALKAQPEVARFEEVESFESTAPFWRRAVKKMTTEKTLRKLTDPATTSLYVLNVYPTPHGLADLLIEYLDENATTRTPKIAKVEATWLPQDLLESVPKAALLKSQTFRRMLDNNMIAPITKGSARLIMDTPEYQVEVERMNESKSKHYRMR